MKIASFVGAILLSFTSLVWAEPVVSRDWTSGLSLDETTQKEICWASTQAITGGAPAELMLKFQKDRQSVPTAFLKVWSGLAADPQLLIKMSAQRSNALFLYEPARKEEDPSVYAYAPIEFPALLSLIASANNLEIKSTAAKLLVSLKGSSAALQNLRKCMGGTEPLPLDFLKSLNAKTENLPNQTHPSAKDMLAKVEEAYQSYLQKTAKDKELKDLRATMKPTLAKEATAQKTYDTALKAWQKTTDQLAAEKLKERNLQDGLAASKSELTRQEAELVVAQQDLAQKKAIYEPLKKEMEPFVQDVAKKDKALQAANQEIKRLKNRIPTIESRISSLRRENSNLSSEIDDLDRRISSARSELDSRDWDVRRFNASSEISSRLFHSWEYSRAEGRIRDLEGAASRAEREWDRARSDLRDLERQYDACRAVPEQNCQSQESAVNQKRNEVRSLESRRDQAIREKWSAENDRERIRREIESQVQRELSDLESKRDQAANVLRDLESRKRSAENQQSSNQSEIRQLQNELAYARKKLPELEASVPSLEQALLQSQQARDAKSAAIGYANAEAQFQAASTRVTTLQKEIPALKKTITKTESDLKKIKPVIAQLEKTLEKQTTTRDQALTKLQPLQEALKPSREIESGLLTVIEDLARRFESAKIDYQSHYRQLLGLK
ncbi:MAG: hypothetical protein KF789_12670 [Bdellovibrionaceae bacterium]|nr:hypothetical protein [Pseudobdellovibrionaceae bacterium]